jgi:hypothetical protein
MSNLQLSSLVSTHFHQFFQGMNFFDPNFMIFYDRVFQLEHQHPMNRLFHISGSVASIFLLWNIFIERKYSKKTLLAFPLVVSIPGLIGHYLFERDDTIGNLRLDRTDYPKLWFLWGNYMMTWDFFTKPFVGFVDGLSRN